MGPENRKYQNLGKICMFILRWTILLFGLLLLLASSIQAFALMNTPDESYWISFVSSRTRFLDRQIYRMRSDGSNVQQLTFAPQTRLAPTYSLDGEYIHFTSFEYGDTEIFRVKANGGILEQVTTRNGRSGSPAYSPDGNYLAFNGTLGNGFNNTTQILLQDLQTNRIFQITDTPSSNLAPQWSPDGEWLVYVSLRHGKAEIYRANLKTNIEERLTHTVGENWYPSFSPDGRWIVFASDRSGQMHLYKMHPDGSNVQQLTFQGDNNVMPAWSPNGEWIAYVSERNQTIEIHKMRADGRDDIALTAQPGDDLFPTWSPVESVQWQSSRLIVAGLLTQILASILLIMEYRQKKFRLIQRVRNWQQDPAR